MSYINFPFPTQPEYTAIAVAYTNRAFIADSVLPRVPVGKREFKWFEYNRSDMFRIPPTLVSRKGMPTEVEFGGVEKSGFVKDHGLDDFVPFADTEDAYEGYDPQANAIEGIMELVGLAREKRTADLVFAPGTYPAANRTTLSGTSQWSHADSDPLKAIQDAMDSMLMRPNQLAISRLGWSSLRRHPKVTAQLVPASTGNSSTTNAQGPNASLQAVQDYLELEAIHVGESFYNTAAEGQTANLSRVWGKHCALLYQRPLASLKGQGITFGATAQLGGRLGGALFDPNRGMRGGYRCRAGEMVDELIIASDCGYFFQDIIA
jgi:hypothetical protein